MAGVAHYDRGLPIMAGGRRGGGRGGGGVGVARGLIHVSRVTHHQMG